MATAHVLGITRACPPADSRHLAQHPAHPLLGGGSPALLYRQPQERRALAYDVWSELGSDCGTGRLAVRTTGRTEQVPSITAALRNGTAELVECGPSTDELERVRRVAIGMTSLGVLTQADRADAAIGFVMGGLPRLADRAGPWVRGGHVGRRRRGDPSLHASRPVVVGVGGGGSRGGRTPRAVRRCWCVT